MNIKDYSYDNNYFIIREDSIAKITIEVNKAIDKNYLPVGNIYTTGVGMAISSSSYYYQAMLKKENKNEETK